MKLILRQWTIVALLTLVVGCAVGSDPDADVISSSSPLASKEAACNKVPAGFTQAEWDKLLLHTPLPAVPADTTNAVAEDPAARKLGQKLFFDPGFSGPLKVASDLGQVGDVARSLARAAIPGRCSTTGARFLARCRSAPISTPAMPRRS